MEERKVGPPGSAPGTERLPGPLESPAVIAGQRPAPSVPEVGGEGVVSTTGKTLPPSHPGRPFSSWNPLACIGSYSLCTYICMYVCIFREWGREGEREGEKDQLVASCSHPN